MKKLSFLFLALFTLGICTTTMSCREQTTGEKVEDAIEDAGDEVEDAVDN